jgi:hypothetical protein
MVRGNAVLRRVQALKRDSMHIHHGPTLQRLRAELDAIEPRMRNGCLANRVETRPGMSLECDLPQLRARHLAIRRAGTGDGGGGGIGDDWEEGKREDLFAQAKALSAEITAAASQIESESEQAGVCGPENIPLVQVRTLRADAADVLAAAVTPAVVSQGERVGAFLPNLGAVDDQALMAHWRRSHAILPEYATAEAVDWSDFTRICRNSGEEERLFISRTQGKRPTDALRRPPTPENHRKARRPAARVGALAGEYTTAINHR